MRTYIITPCYRQLHNGVKEQQGYDVTCPVDRWKVSHGAVELCETAIFKYEKLRSIGKKTKIYGKDYQILYKNCVSEAKINEARLSLYK